MFSRIKISQLYIKIFLSVLVGLVLAEVLIFSVFRRIYHDEFRSEVGCAADSQALLVRNFVASRLENGRSLQEICEEPGRFVPGRVWVLNEERQVLAASVPALSTGLQEFTETLNEVFEEEPSPAGLRVEFTGRVLYALLPLGFSADRSGYLYTALERRRRGKGESSFLLALAGIAMAFALLLYPLSGMLSRPLGELRASALRIADGDLEHRVRPRGSDDIGELGRSFNVMADRVQRMVTGTRELTAHVSHELRSPLARIRVATELLKDREKVGKNVRDSRQQRRLLFEEIDAEIDDLDRLIGCILQLSRLDLQSPAPPRPRAALR